MNIVLKNGKRAGKVTAPSSKSQIHRLLICAALGESVVKIRFNGLSRDICATVGCLNALGAEIYLTGINELEIRPIKKISRDNYNYILDCGESGSTLRFLLPVVGILGVEAIFKMHGRLSERPIAPFDLELINHGMTFNKNNKSLGCTGKLESGIYSLPGNISSQYISGLLMALPHLVNDSEIKISGEIESLGYIKITEDVLNKSNIRFNKTKNGYYVFGSQKYNFPDYIQADGDFSNAAFFLCIGAMSKQGVEISGLSLDSPQGDIKIIDILNKFGAEIIKSQDKIIAKYNYLRGIILDASQIPDLIPVLSVVAAVSDGETRIINAQRLRLKESDRIESTAAMLRALGIKVETYKDSMIIHGQKKFSGGTVDPFGDHRIAMAAAVAACACDDLIIIKNMECVEKSYPKFWEDFLSLSLSEV